MQLLTLLLQLLQGLQLLDAVADAQLVRMPRCACSDCAARRGAARPQLVPRGDSALEVAARDLAEQLAAIQALRTQRGHERHAVRLHLLARLAFAARHAVAQLFLNRVFAMTTQTLTLSF